MSRDRERSFVVEGKTRDEILQLLDEFTSGRQEGPAWINPLPILTHHGRGILCEISQDPGYGECGSIRFRPLPGREKAFRVDVRPGDFLEPDLFRQTVDELIRVMRQQGASMRGWLAPEPPMPKKEGRRVNWDPVFDWYYQWQEENRQRMRLEDLAAKLSGYTVGYIRQRKAMYDAEHD